MCLHRARAAELGGIEFVCAIPGTVGGAVWMNAGAYGGDIAGVLERALVADAEGTRWLTPAELGLQYRTSGLRHGQVVARAELRLAPRPVDEIKATVAEMQAKRKDAQPTNKRTFGSVFKNPEHELTAGRMLEACALRGHRIGGAQISPKHANFIENAGEATSADAVALIVEARRRASEQFGVHLHPEVQLLGAIEIPPLADADPSRRPGRTAWPGGELDSVVRRPHSLSCPHTGWVAACALRRLAVLRSGEHRRRDRPPLSRRARDAGLRAPGAGGLRRVSPAVRRSVEAAAKPYVGESLVALDQDELRRQLQSLSTVRSVRLDRAFPHTLRISVVPERPAGRRAARAGRMARVRAWPRDPGARSRPAQRAHERVGRSRHEPRRRCGTVQDEELRAILDALRRVPDTFPARVSMARVEDEEVTLVLASGIELHPRRANGAAAQARRRRRGLLSALTAEERGELGYLDVTVPGLPVGGDKSQLSS